MSQTPDHRCIACETFDAVVVSVGETVERYCGSCWSRGESL